MAESVIKGVRWKRLGAVAQKTRVSARGRTLPTHSSGPRRRTAKRRDESAMGEAPVAGPSMARPRSRGLPTGCSKFERGNMEKVHALDHHKVYSLPLRGAQGPRSAERCAPASATCARSPCRPFGVQHVLPSGVPGFQPFNLKRRTSARAPSETPSRPGSDPACHLGGSFPDGTVPSAKESNHRNPSVTNRWDQSPAPWQQGSCFDTEQPETVL